ncbi:MAG: ATP-binding protein [Pseudomonadota bacterium]|nr:ATP-binding protein [Pseudomonadota bacterium]
MNRADSESGAMADLIASSERRPLIPYPVRFTRLVAAVALPTAALFGGFAANAAVSPQAALVSWIGVNGLALWLARRHMMELWRHKSAIRRLMERPARPAVADGVDAEPDVGLMVERLGRDLADERARARAGEAALRSILDSLQLPVMTFGADRRLDFMNLSAKDIFGSGLETKDFAAALRNPEVLRGVDGIIADRVSREIEFPIFAPVPRQMRVRIDALPAHPGARTGFVAMIDDVTDSRRMQEMRSDFVADVSHELRTPLASVLSIVETLVGPARNDEQARDRFLKILKEQSERMAVLVDDLLSLSRIEQHEHQPPRGVTDLVPVIRSVVEALDLAATAREMDVLVDMPDRLQVIGDRDELTRVARNLVENAIKYGDRGTPVRIVGRALERVAEIQVIDRGPGIAREHLPRLTERFYRVDRARSRAAGGTGLGLAIVKHVVNRHRGQLQIDSEEGLGSVVTVQLPLAPA